MELFSAEKARLTSNIIERFKNPKKLTGLNADDTFAYCNVRRTRRNGMRIWRERSRLKVRTNFCSRVVNQWNRLNEEVVSVRPLRNLKNF